MPDEQSLSQNARTALAALRRCTATELNAIRDRHLWAVQNEVLAREEYDMDDAVTLGDRVPPFAVDGPLAEELDEDGDEVLEPTPLVPVDQFAGVRTALDEADGD